ncbi:MAG: tetratricopeptide repeat protein [Desulfobacterales bacterium]|nr:tetratricopeptide repeat protein [Desulfobacterales bacterium]
MSRFKKLELDGDAGGKPVHGGGRGADARNGGFATKIKDADFYMERAEKHELAGDHEKALRFFSSALGENHLLIDAWTGQARMLLELEEYHEARMWMNKALEIIPNNPRLLAVKSIALHRMGKSGRARELNDAALKGKGESEIVWFCRGEIMLTESQPAAMECFKHAKRLTINKDLLHLRVGALFLRRGELSQALSHLQKASGGLPDSARAWHLLGISQRELGLYDQARVSFKQAVRLSPYNRTYRKDLEMKKPGLAAAVANGIRRLFNK